MQDESLALLLLAPLQKASTVCGFNCFPTVKAQRSNQISSHKGNESLIYSCRTAGASASSDLRLRPNSISSDHPQPCRSSVQRTRRGSPFRRGLFCGKTLADAPEGKARGFCASEIWGGPASFSKLPKNWFRPDLASSGRPAATPGVGFLRASGFGLARRIDRATRPPNLTSRKCNTPPPKLPRAAVPQLRGSSLAAAAAPAELCAGKLDPAFRRAARGRGLAF